MSIELVMPRAGLTMVEGTISSWLVSEGASVKKGDTLAFIRKMHWNTKTVKNMHTPSVRTRNNIYITCRKHMERSWRNGNFASKPR